MSEADGACTPAPAGAVFFCIKGQGYTARPGRGKSLGRGVLTVALRHNLRHSMPGHPSPKGVDATLTHRNEVVMGGATPEEVMQSYDAALAAKGISKPTRKDAWLAIEVVFGTHPGMKDPNGYLRACAEWLGRATGAPVVSAVIHRDQSTPHLHAIVVPVTDAGEEQNVGKEKRPSDGRAWKGSDLFCSDAMARLNKDHAVNVAAKFGLKRKSKPTRLQHEAVVYAVLKWMEQSPARECVTWPETEALIRLDPFPWAKRIGLDTDHIMASIGLAERLTRPAGEDAGQRRSQRQAQAKTLPPGHGHAGTATAAVDANSLGETPSQDRSSAPTRPAERTSDQLLRCSAGEEAQLLRCSAAPMTPPPRPPISPPPRPVLPLVPSAPAAQPKQTPTPTPTPEPAKPDEAPRYPPMTPELQAELELQDRPKNPSPAYLQFEAADLWRFRQEVQRKLARRQTLPAKAATH